MAIVNPLAFLPTTPGQGVSILFGAAQLLGGGPTRVELDTLTIDCTLSETIEMEAEVSEFEVEAGSNITDNRRTKPVEISIAGVISDTPIDKSLIAEALRLAAGPLNIPIDALGALKGLGSAAASISSQAFYKLQSLFEFGSLASDDGTFTVLTSFRSYDRMTIKSLRFARDAKTGKALAFTCTLKEIRTVATSTTALPSLPMLQAPLDLGTKTPGPSKLDPDALYKKTIGPALDAMGLPAKPPAFVGPPSH